MIQSQTILKVVDNSGAKTVKCIKVLGGFKKRYGSIGDLLVVSVQTIRSTSEETTKVKRGEVYRALVVQTKNSCYNNAHEFFNSAENSVILINKQDLPVGTRIIVGLPRFLKKKKYQKFVSISSGLF